MQTSIYTYTELPGYLQSLKDARPDLSYDKISETLKLRSRTLAKKIVKGQTTFPKKLVEPFCDLFNLNNDEKNYFELLRSFSFSSKTDNIVGLYQKMIDQRKRHLDVAYSELSESELGIIEKWYLLPLLYYFRLPQSQSDPYEIRKDFKAQLSESEIADGINLLARLKFIKNESGKITSTDKEIVLFDGLPRALVKKFHESMIERALKSVQSQDVDKRYLLSASLNLRSQDVSKLNSRIEQFFKNLNEEFCLVSDANEIRQLNIQFFQVAVTRS